MPAESHPVGVTLVLHYKSALEMLEEGDRENLRICCALQWMLDEPTLRNHPDRGLWEAEMRFHWGMFPIIRQEIMALTKTGQLVG